MVTLPKTIWNKIDKIGEDLDAGVSDGLYMIVSLGFDALGNEEVMALLSDEEEEDLEEEEEED